MSVPGVETLTAECAHVPVVENVDDPVARGHVPALDEHRLRAHVRHDFLGRPRHRILVVDLFTNEDRRLVQIWCHEKCLRDELAAYHLDRVALEQHIARGGHHHRIQNVIAQRVLTDRAGDYRCNGSVGEHPALERRGREIFRH